LLLFADLNGQKREPSKLRQLAKAIEAVEFVFGLFLICEVYFDRVAVTFE
jgi:hypothetical protein